MSQKYKQINKSFKGDGKQADFIIKNNGAPVSFILGDHSLYEGNQPQWMDDFDGYYTIEEVFGENSSVSTRRGKDDLIIQFDSISGRTGEVVARINLEGKERMDINFPWNTDVVSNTKPVTLSMELSNDRFIINSAYRADIAAWSDSMAASYLDTFIEESDSIKVHFNTKNTNLNGLYLSSDGIKSNPIGTKIIYGDGSEQYFLPLNIFDNKVGNSYSAPVVPGNYYILAVEKGSYTKAPSVQFSNESQGAISTFTLEKNYLFNNTDAAILRAPGGAEKLTIDYESEKVPFLFLFEPILSLRQAIRREDLIANGKLDIAKFKEVDNNYLDKLPKNHIEDSKSPFKFKINWVDGSGYLEITPEVAADPKYFSNRFADTTSLIKATASTGEETAISIYREVRPYRDIDSLKGEIIDATSGKYIDRASLLTLLQSRESVSIAANSITRLVTPSPEDEIVIEIPAGAPGNVPHEMFYDTDNGETVLNILSSSSEEEDLRSIFGLSLYDNSFYYLEMKLRNDKGSLKGRLDLSNMSYLSETGREAKDGLDFSLQQGKEQPFRFLIPPSGVKMNTVSKEIKDYLELFNLDTNGLEILFENRPEVENSFAGYYMYLTPENLQRDSLKLTGLRVRELRIPITKKINPYLPIQSRNEYSVFLDNTSAFIARVNELELDYNAAVEAGVQLETKNYRDVLGLFKEAESSIKEIEYLMSKYESEKVEASIYKVENDGRNHTIGFSNSLGWLSSISISPSGAVIQGEKNKIIGSTSIGALYGKKMVLGKEPTAADREHDKLYRESTKESEGFMAIWDNENKRWSSNLNKDGQFFYRYDDKESQGSLVGYMVMNSKEIAAYQFPAVREGFDGVIPPDMTNPLTTQDEYPVFKITGDGSVEINNLVVRSSSEVDSTVDLMDSVRILRYDYKGATITRRGIVFIGID